MHKSLAIIHKLTCSMRVRRVSDQKYITEFHCPYSCLKGHSCEKCLSNYVLDLDLKMQTHVSSILNDFCLEERSHGLHCYSIKGDSVLVLSVLFCRKKQVFQ